MPAVFHPTPLLLLVAIPRPVLACEVAGLAVLALGLLLVFVRPAWREARGFDKLILFGPTFYATAIAAFGTEHFMFLQGIASIVPAWLPWHLFWASFVGACLIAAGLSLSTGVQARLAASLLALLFFLFVVLMDVPGWAHHPSDRFATALLFRELAFSGGALGLAVSLGLRFAPAGTPSAERNAPWLAIVARCFVAVPILFYSYEQFRHGDHVPGIPLELVTPTWIWGHAVWTYVTALVYAVFGPLLLIGWKPRLAASLLGLVVLVGIVAIYLPMGIVERATLDMGLNYPADTLMFCGAVLMLAAAMPRDERSAR